MIKYDYNHKHKMVKFMGNSEIIDVLEKLSKISEQDLDSKKIDEITDYLLNFAEINIKTSKSKFNISISKLNTNEVMSKFSIEENELPSYIKKSMDIIGKSLKRMVIDYKNPESPLEEKIFNKFDVENLRLKTLLKKEYVMPIFENSKIYETSRAIGGNPTKYYILKIEYDTSKTISFEITRNDLKRLQSLIKTALDGGNDD